MTTSLNPFDWDEKELQTRAPEWVIDLDAKVPRSEMHAFLAPNAQDWQDWANVPFPDFLKNISIRLQELVLQQTGIALLKCGLQRTPDEARLLQLMLGCEFGLNVTKTPDSADRSLFALQIEGDPTAGGKYTGNGLRPNAIGFHTDGSGSTDRNVELLSLLCICPARFGGQSRVASSQRAFNSLPSEAREALKKAFPRENPFAPGAKLAALKVAPIFCEVTRHGVSYLHFSYHPDRVKNGIEADPKHFGPEINGWLKMLDKALNDCSCDINLMSNEILFVNNCVIAHDRRAFVDDPNSKRFLERFWAGTFVKAVTGEGDEHRSFRASAGQ